MHLCWCMCNNAGRACTVRLSRLRLGGVWPSRYCSKAQCSLVCENLHFVCAPSGETMLSCERRRLSVKVLSHRQLGFSRKSVA